MIQPQRILVIEIKTMDNPGLDSTQLSTLIAFGDSDNPYLDLDIKPIKSAILDAILHLGSNYRHPLLFDVPVLSGDSTDALAESNNPPSQQRRRRRRRRRRRSDKSN